MLKNWPVQICTGVLSKLHMEFHGVGRRQDKELYLAEEHQRVYTRKCLTSTELYIMGIFDI